MKTCIYIALAALLFSACKKNNEPPTYQNQGAITGVEIMFCDLGGHCGGVQITIQNDPTPNPPKSYLIDTAITALGISENAAFPVNVSLNWHHDPNYNGYIIVDKLKVN